MKVPVRAEGAFSQWWLATLHFEPAISILKLSMTGPATGDGFHPESTGTVSDARRMEGGVAGLR